jgi:hypothetical protein
MKNNKEDSAALAEHALKITKKLFDALQSLNHLESMKSSIDDFVEYVALLFPLNYSHSIYVHRVLSGIASFSQERTGRKAYQLALKKQSDADEIKKWDRELTRTYERFNVTL